MEGERDGKYRGIEGEGEEYVKRGEIKIIFNLLKILVTIQLTIQHI